MSETHCPYGSGPHRARREIIASRSWEMRIEQTSMRVHVAAVLMSGAIGDYAAYVSATLANGVLDHPITDDPNFCNWVGAYGVKLVFEDALQIFPGITERKYRP